MLHFVWIISQYSHKQNLIQSIKQHRGKIMCDRQRGASKSCVHCVQYTVQLCAVHSATVCSTQCNCVCTIGGTCGICEGKEDT
jgi:hypothetical protein